MNNCCTVSLVVVGMVDILSWALRFYQILLDGCKHLDLFWGGECNTILLLVIATTHYRRLLTFNGQFFNLPNCSYFAPSINMVALLFMVAPLVMVAPPMITLNFQARRVIFLTRFTFCTTNMVAPSINMVAPQVMVAPLVMVAQPMVTLNFLARKTNYWSEKGVCKR
jgi:hypothetical protein